MGKNSKKKITTIARQKQNSRRVYVIILVSVLTLFLIRFKYVSAASSPWTQTDWSGGSGSSTTNQYTSVSGIDPLTTAGEFYLDDTSGWSEDYSSWLYRKKITFDNTDANLGVTSEDLTNFPVLLKLDSGVEIDYSKTKDAGEDLRFTDSDGTVLSYEIEKWNESGASYVWVKVPQININSNNDFVYMYYGNSSASDSQNASGVWDSNYVGVWHLDETSGTVISDSTGVNAGAKVDASNPAVTANGQINGAQDFSGDTITVNDSASLDLSSQMTISGWVTADSVPTWGSILMKAPNGNWDTGYGIYYNSNLCAFVTSYSVNKACSAFSTTVVPRYVVGTYNGTTIRLYLDGVSAASSSPSVAITTNSGNLTIGRGSGGNYDWDGIIDEVRVSNVARSAAYIAASYKSESDDLLTYESEVTKYSSTGTLVSSIFDTGFPSDWGNLTYSTSGLGTVTVKVRTSNSATMVGATDWSSCAAKSSGADLSGGCVTDAQRYVQYQVTLEPSGASSPIFSNISIIFTASDQDRPVTNATVAEVAGVTDDDWVKEEPIINWIDGADNVGGVGILGYCISLDETSVAAASTGLDPAITSGLLTGIDDGVSSNACPFIVTDNSVNLANISGLTLTENKKYYVSLKAVDSAGNVFTGDSSDYQDLTNFKFDNAVPTNVTYISTPSGNFGSVNDMFFTWPISGGGVSSDGQSGIAGWQYSLNGTSDWKGPDTNSTLGITYIENDGSTSSHAFTEGDDGDDIVVGTNTIYFRVVDNAGNFSTSVTGGISYGGAAPTFLGGSTVSVTPSTSTSNSYALSWDAATPSTGTIDSYYYMINTTPPSTLATLIGNSTQYIPVTSTSVSAKKLTGAVKGSNNVYVVAVDSEDNYSPSNYISGSFTLNSSNPDAAQNLSVSDTSIKSEEIWRASLAWDEPAYKGTGTLTYIIQRSTDNSSWTQVATSTGTSYTDTVEESTTYYYKVGTYDTSDESEDDPTYTTSISILPKGAFDAAPTLSSGPTVTEITTRKALIKWATSRVADSRVQYGTKSGDYFEEEPSKSEQLTSHEILLTNLRPGTKYYYKVKWTDEDGNIGISSEKTFTTDPAPKIGDIKVTNIGINSANINFTVANSTSIKIYYGTTKAFGSVAEQNTSSNESVYSVQLNDLEDGTKYYFKINSFDSEAEEYEGNDLDFETLPRPQIANVRLQQAKNTAQPTAVVSWSTNTEVSSIVTYFPSGNPSAARDEVNVALIRGEHRMIIRGLVPNTRYDLRVSGRDVAGNEAQSEVQTFTTATDTRPPSMSDLKVEGSSVNKNTQTQTSQLIVSWTSDEAATGQVEFGEGTGTVYSQKTQEDANYTFNHLVVIPGLTPSKVYHLRAVSKDKAGNVTQSIDIVTITPKASDNALDLVVSNLREAFGFALK